MPSSSSSSRRPSPCFDRFLEGTFSGTLVGFLWGSLVALHARTRAPSPSAMKQVTEIVGGHVAGLGVGLGVYNGVACQSKQVRDRYSSSVSSDETFVDGAVGGFTAGFLVGIPMHITRTPAVRVQWKSCLVWGAQMALVGAVMHSLNQPPTATQQRFHHQYAPMSSAVKVPPQRVAQLSKPHLFRSSSPVLVSKAFDGNSNSMLTVARSSI